jgi:hypothetical protein
MTTSQLNRLYRQATATWLYGQVRIVEMAAKRKTPRQPVIRFDLGSRQKLQGRLTRLDAIAGQFGVTHSVLIRTIADGDLRIMRAVDEQSQGD